MIPTIEINDRVLAEKISYRFIRQPEYGDIVVFDDPTKAHPQLIKRVIATEGQTVDIQDGAVYVDGKKLDEPYLDGVRTDPGSVPLPIKVPAGYVWLMGDNRPTAGTAGSSARSRSRRSKGGRSGRTGRSLGSGRCASRRTGP